jgi:hypothetical protein
MPERQLARICDNGIFYFSEPSMILVVQQVIVSRQIKQIEPFVKKVKAWRILLNEHTQSKLIASDFFTL